MQAQVNVEAIWEKVVDEIKLKVIRPTLWRSMEIAVPIIAEENQFIVGFPSGSFHMSGNLTTADHLNAIQAALKQFTGIPFTLRIIQGDSVEDWTQFKYKEAHLQRLREEDSMRREREAAASQTWDNLLEQIGRRYAAMNLRQLPQSRARYIREMVETISASMDDLMATAPEELAERSLARAIDKVAQLSEVPATLIAYELLRHRGE